CRYENGDYETQDSQNEKLLINSSIDLECVVISPGRNSSRSATKRARRRQDLRSEYNQQWSGSEFRRRSLNIARALERHESPKPGSYFEGIKKRTKESRNEERQSL